MDLKNSWRNNNFLREVLEISWGIQNPRFEVVKNKKSSSTKFFKNQKSENPKFARSSFLQILDPLGRISPGSCENLINQKIVNSKNFS